MMEHSVTQQYPKIDDVKLEGAMTKVLIVEDDHTIAESVELFLRKESYKTERAKDGKRALELWRSFKPDLIVLDIGLPELDGYEVLRTIRTEDNVPVIFLTARTEEIDELLGMGLGADDYLTKPFSLRKLLVHIKAVLRRAFATSDDAKPIRVGGVEVDPYRVRASVNETVLNLTPTEFKLLHHLAKSPGRAVSRWELIEETMPESEALGRAVDSHMKNLRQKLSDAGAPNLIETVRTVGYRLVE
jgi:two-component system, OmpR family, response regulator AdeR